MQQQVKQDVGVGIGLGVLAALVYLLVFSGNPLSTDEIAMFTGVQSLVQRGVFSATPLYWDTNGTVLFGAPGHAYPNFEPAQMILAAPLYALAQPFAGVGLLHAVWLFNVFVTAATVSLFYWVGRRLGYSVHLCAALAVVFAVGSMAFPYARTFFREPLSAFALLLAFFGMLGMGTPRYRSNAALAGIGLGLAYAAKSANIVAWPVIAVAGLLYALRLPRRRRQLLALLWMAMPALLGLAAVTWLATLNDTGIGADAASRGMNTLVAGVGAGRWESLWTAIAGYLFSPGKSLFVHTPFALPALIGLPLFVRRDWRAALAVLGIVVGTVLGYAYTKGDLWYGGLNWGPRFLLPVTPFLLLPALPLLAWTAQRRPLHWVVAALGVVSVAVQMPAVLLPFQRYAEEMGRIAPNAMWTLAIYDWRYAPVIYGWRLMDWLHLDFMWTRFVAFGGAVDWAALLTLVLSTAAATWMVVSLLRGRRLPRWVWMGVALPLLTAAVLVRNSVVDPRLPGGEDRLALVQRLNHQVESGDAVVLFNHVLLPFYLNTMRAPAAVYAVTPDRGLLPPQSQALFAALHAERRRIWLLSDDTAEIQPPPRHEFRPDEAWWTARAGVLHEEVTSPHARATLFIAPAETERLDLPVLSFEDGVDLAAIYQQEGDGWRYLELHWQARSPISSDYTVFFHLLDAGGALVWQQDRRPQRGFAPTTAWTPDEVVVDPIAVPTGALPPGRYRLILGLYTFENGNLRPLPTVNGENTVDLGWVDQ